MTKKPPKYSSPWYSADGLLYFIAAGSPVVAIKIGVTKIDSYRRRLKGIQSSNHEPIEVLGVVLFNQEELPMASAEKLERELHRRFAHLQRTRAGIVGQEWFSATPELLEFIMENSTPPENAGLSRTVAQLAQNQEASKKPLGPAAASARRASPTG